MQNDVQIDVLKTNKDHLSDFQVTKFAAQCLELYICYVVIVNIYMLSFVVCVNQFDTNSINTQHKYIDIFLVGHCIVAAPEHITKFSLPTLNSLTSAHCYLMHCANTNLEYFMLTFHPDEQYFMKFTLDHNFK